MTILYRQHRGSLADSMETVQPVESVDDIRKIEDDLREFGYDLSVIEVKPYGFDARIGWDTHIVTVPGYGPLGFTSGPLSPSANVDGGYDGK